MDIVILSADNMHTCLNWRNRIFFLFIFFFFSFWQLLLIILFFIIIIIIEHISESLMLLIVAVNRYQWKHESIMHYFIYS